MKTGAQFGHTVSKETRLKISLAKMGVPVSEETRQKMRMRRASEETKKKQSISGKLASNSLEYRELKRQISLKNGNKPPIHRGKDHPMWKGGISKTREYQNYYIRLNKAKRRGASGTYTKEDWELLKKRVNYMCLCCKKFEPEIKLTIDHIIPIYFGGSNNISNLQPLCLSCNSRKSTKDTDYLSSYMLTQPRMINEEQ